MKPLPNYAEDATVDIKFNVFDSNGEPGLLAGTLTESVSVYKTGNPTPHTQAYTPALLDSLTGVYSLIIDMSAHAFFEVGKDYTAVLTGAGITASGTAVTNTILGRWSCENQSASIPDGGITANTFDTGVLATDADIADAVWDEARADHDTAGTFGEGTAAVIGGINTGSGTVTTLDGLDTNLSNDIAALNNLDSAAVTAACTSSLNTYDPPTRTEATADKDAILAALPSSGPSAATIADAVLDEALSGHATAGTVGAALTDILADTAELQGDWANGGRLDLILDGVAAGGSAPTAAAIADAVWTEAIADHSGEAGSTAEALNNAGAAGTVSTAQVSNERTWFAEEYRSRNIVTVGNGFAGTFAVVPDINPETTIASVSSVAITGAASVTASSSAVRADKQAAHFTVPALTTSGTYTVVVKVLTNDSQTIPTTCTLKVV